MKKIDWGKLTVAQIGGAICSHLLAKKFDATLTGGACVSIYTNNKYQSGDLDFVMPMYGLNEIDESMGELGFKRIKPQRHYVNPQCPYFVEFPPPPLSIGLETIKETGSIKTRYGTLKLLTPTDCVKDRLAAYYHWKDRQSFEQALMVAVDQEIDLYNIEEWSRKEISIDKFVEFKERLLNLKKR